MSGVSIIKVEDILDSVSDSYFIEEQTGMPTGWISLDRHYTVLPGQFTIVTGVPSHGKSEFIDALCVNLAVKHGWRFLVFSPENYPITTHVKKLIRKFIGKPFGKMYNGTMSKDEAVQGIKFVNESFLFVYPGENLITIDDLIYASENVDIDGFIIDPWNELDHRRPAGMREDEYISLSLGKLRNSARSQDIHTWLIAHPKKPDPGRNYKTHPPMLYDVSGGAHWYNKADNVTMGGPTHTHKPSLLLTCSRIRYHALLLTVFAS
jgi:twinkle protein